MLAGEAEVASAQSNGRRFNLRRVVQDERLPLLSRELKPLRVEVAALLEVRPGSGMISMGWYTYYWSGRGDGHLQGVDIAISRRRQPLLEEVSLVDERIVALRPKHAFGFVSIIAIYAPTDVCKLDVKETFNAKLTSVVDKFPQQDICIVLGDFMW
ncbi:craniofacial development protein 2-like [Penaeus vannamei]|uniref:craniofacial development protein 2-like n=1 Tax=Penaeus vannamei TaxID=6689 RepID=UPI00387F7880